MAELNVQPKKKTYFLPWLLLLLGIAVLVWFLATRNKDDDNIGTTSNDTTTVATTAPATSINRDTTGWNDIDFNASEVKYEEITDKDINVRGNDNYSIYGLGEKVLFDEGKATIRKDAVANLKQILTSINKRFNNGEIKIYGYTDAKGAAGVNRELAQQRADAVKTWLQNNGLDATRISENAIGEAQPAATNTTAAGRQQNRRVEIVARNASASR